MLTEQEFAQKIKKKYPQYAKVADSVLVRKIMDKHPEYKDQVAFNSPGVDFLSEEQKGVKGVFSGVGRKISGFSHSGEKMLRRATSPIKGLGAKNKENRQAYINEETAGEQVVGGTGFKGRNAAEKLGGTAFDVASTLAGGMSGRAVGAVGARAIASRGAAQGSARTLAQRGAQKAAQILPESVGATTAFEAAHNQELPGAKDLSIGLAADILVPKALKVAGKSVKAVDNMVSDSIESLKRGHLSPYTYNVFKKVADAGRESPLFKKYTEYVTAQRKYTEDQVRNDSALSAFGKKVFDELKNVKVKTQDAGSKIGAALDASVGRADVSKMLSEFEGELANIRVKPRFLQVIDGKASDVTNATNSDEVMSKIIFDDVFSGETAKLNEMSKGFAAFRKGIKGFDGLDLPGAINKAKATRNKAAKEFLDRFGRFDEEVAELFGPGADANDIFMRIKDVTYSPKKGKVSNLDIRPALTDESFKGSGIELTPEDQKALINTYNAFYKRLQDGVMSKRDVDSLARSIKNLVKFSKGNAAQSLTEAEVPLVGILDKMKKYVKSGMSAEELANYELYGKGKEAQSLLGKKLGDFAQGKFSVGKSALNERKIGQEMRKAFADIKEITGRDFLEDLDIVALVADDMGDAQTKSLLNLVSPRLPSGIGEAAFKAMQAGASRLGPVAAEIFPGVSSKSELLEMALESGQLDDVPAGLLRQILNVVYSIAEKGSQVAEPAGRIGGRSLSD